MEFMHLETGHSDHCGCGAVGTNSARWVGTAPNAGGSRLPTRPLAGARARCIEFISSPNFITKKEKKVTRKAGR